MHIYVIYTDIFTCLCTHKILFFFLQNYLPLRHVSSCKNDRNWQQFPDLPELKSGSLYIPCEYISISS